jgi:hypothetical protein
MNLKKTQFMTKQKKIFAFPDLSYSRATHKRAYLNSMGIIVSNSCAEAQHRKAVN